MFNKRLTIKTCYRVINLLVLEYLIYRNEKIDVFFSAVAITSIAFWLLPALLTSLTSMIFKIKEEYGGTLQYDDTDPTDCKFRMIFSFEPEELAQRDEFAIKVEKANLMNPISDQNKD